jgi:hypothetical protein
MWERRANQQRRLISLSSGEDIAGNFETWVYVFINIKPKRNDLAYMLNDQVPQAVHICGHNVELVE